MSETVFPPCPNWFLPRVLSCNRQGTIAYGSRSNVIVCSHKPDMSLSNSVTVSIVSSAHKDRVTMVLLSTASADRGNFPDTVVSSAEDSVIKLWDVHSHGLILEQTVHVGHILVAVDWSRADPDLLVSVDKQGLVVFWNMHSNTVHKLTFRKLNASCLACSPHQPDIVAVGTQSGLVNILSSKERGQVVHRMRGHDDEVCALAWCPVDYNVLDPDKPREALLASGCKGRQVFLWRTHTDGRVHAQLSLPPHPFAGHGKFAGGGGTSSFYLCLLWPEPATLVTNALYGEMLAWDLSRLEAKEKSKTMSTTNLFPRGKKGGWPSYVRLLHGFHPRAAYAIAAQPYKNCNHSEENGEEEQSKDGSELSARPCLLWSTSQDRYIVACDLSTGKVVTKIPTFSSSVYSIAASPLDPSRISIGVGDAAIRVWNLNNSAEFDVSCYWQRIKTKVLSLSWHPLKEDVLAFATGEGRVGLLTVTGSKPPVVFKMQHRGSVYSMCWGPFSYGQDNVPNKIPEVALYTCGNGEIFQFDPSSPEECSLYPMEMVKQVSADKKMVQGSELSWKSDNSVFAVGLSDGSVHVFSSPHLLLLHSVYTIKKYIQMFAWHPESTATDSGFSPYCNWLAVSANEKSIRVFNFTPVIESLQGGGSGLTSTAVECCAVLSGHEDKVPCICWNPHISGQLVSVSYDSTAQVWDVASETALVVFTGHDGSVFSCLWSPLDPDLVFTGGADATLHAWRVSRQTYKSVHQLVAQKKTALKRLKRSNEAVGKQLHEQVVEEAVAPPPSTTDQQQAQAVESKRTKPKSLLSSVKTVEDDKMEQYLDACGALLRHSGDESICCREQEEAFPLFALYSDRKSVCRLLDREASAGKESLAITESMQHYELWKGNIAELLKTAAREKRLSTLLVSLAPLASPRLWLEMCKAYADQLAEAGHVQKAASYLIACHRLEEAIALLADRDRFADALVLAKCRGTDPALISGILRKWADKLVLSGKLEQAAERLVVVGDLEGACQLYAGSKHMASHRFAALVAKKAGLVDKALSIARDALLEHLVDEKWDVADCIIAEHPQLKPLEVLRWTQHQVLSQVAGGAPWGALRPWLCGARGTPPPSLLHQLEACAAQHAVSKEQLGLALRGSRTSTCPRDAGGQMWLEVSRGLCLAWTTTADQLALPHVLKVVDTVYQMQLHCSSAPHMLLLLLCSGLAPSGPLADGSVFVSASYPPACGPFVKSLRAYLCAAIVFWLEGRPADPDKLEAVSSEPVADKPCVDVSGGGDVRVNDCETVSNGEVLTGNAECSWFGVCRILTELVEDVVNAEAIRYFKTELQIKKLTASLASAVAGGAVLQGGGDGMSEPDPILGEQGDAVAGQEDAGGGDLPPAKVSLDLSKGAEVVETVSTAEWVEDVGGAEKDKEASAVQSDTGAVFSELEQLKTSKEAFEAERVCVPNPYFLWFKLQNVCEAVLAKHEPQGASNLRSQLALLRSTHLD